jgi:large subunit ribosomal protein L4
VRGRKAAPVGTAATRAEMFGRWVRADGTPGDERALPGTLFDGRVNRGALYAAVKAYRANRRQGTAAAKTRAEVSGGGRKPWRQKGTGRARQGSIRAPHWRGGGVVHPPVPRDWSERLPRKVRALARRSALNLRAREGAVVVAEGLALAEGKTREVVAWLRAAGLADRKVLILTAGLRPDLVRAARNLPRVCVRPFGEETAYEVLWSDAVCIEAAALAQAADAGGGAGAAGEARDA